MRAVLDVNVIIAGLLSANGPSAALLRLWLGGAFELVLSETLLGELTRALAYPRIRQRVPVEDATAFVDLLRTTAAIAPDPPHPPRRSRDAGDDYLLALAAATGSVLVSGDDDVLALRPAMPVVDPHEFLGRLQAGGS